MPSRNIVNLGWATDVDATCSIDCTAVTGRSLSTDCICSVIDLAMVNGSPAVRTANRKPLCALCELHIYAIAPDGAFSPLVRTSPTIPTICESVGKLPKLTNLPIGFSCGKYVWASV